MLYAIPPLQKPKPVPAASCPAIPGRPDVSRAAADCERELARLRTELQQLEHSQKRGSLSLPPSSARSAALAVQDFHGMMMPHGVIAEVEAAGRARAARAAERWNLPNARNYFRKVSDLPGVAQMQALHEEIAEPMMAAICSWKAVAAEKVRGKAVEYVERREIWESYARTLSESGQEERSLLAVWPKEFAKPRFRSLDSIREHAGGDQPMYLDPGEAESYGFFDMNGLVTDPVAEHRAYRQRLVWTDAEVTTFVERYAQHPRDFKRIAGGLPGKSVKDVIEFYNIHRGRLNLKELDIIQRKKGKKRVITEGTLLKV
jgi:hypothetical protein